MAVGLSQGEEAARSIVDGGLEGVRGAHKIEVCVDTAKCVGELAGGGLEAEWKKKCKARFARATTDF